MVVGSLWKSQSFWLTIVGAIAAIIAGILTEAEVELFTSAAALVIAYLVTRGVLAAKVAEANKSLGAADKPTEVNF